jgi:hypothetical protein
VRSILRHRDTLVQMAATHVQHMQKALDQMNLQLHHVIADITGFTGLAIIEAILAGERDPHALAALRDGRALLRAPAEITPLASQHGAPKFVHESKATFLVCRQRAWLVLLRSVTAGR